jgi:trk system potassium uptake protein TrkA
MVEEKLPPGSKVLDIPLKDLPLPDTCVIAAVIRNGVVLTPRGNMTFEIGDEVLAVVDDESKGVLQDLFASQLVYP